MPVNGNGTEPLGHGDVVIAAITSCTNTSNPSVMLAAGLLAKARSSAASTGAAGQGVARSGFARGERLSRQDRPATIPRPAWLQPRWLWLHNLHRQLRAARGVEKAILDNNLVVASVLSGNRTSRRACTRTCAAIS
ncbi:MAG: hypothetical protein CM1200mP34_3630 [Verrucomicrobiales bacterium]|nr:MAG: hypothetical protein CM1200mP34_3630 [Verrucomicrobiales bacterium]